MKAPVGISVDGAEGPGSYGLNRGVNVTILVANKNRVTANFALVQPSPTDAAKILNEVTKLIGGRTPGTAEIVFLSKPTRKLKTAKFKIAPTDVMLRRLICRVLAARNRAEVQKAAREVAKYVDKNAARRAALADTAIMLLQRPRELSKSPAIPIIRRWRGK